MILRIDKQLTEYYSAYCFRVTSSEDESLCQHPSPGAGPHNWQGGLIDFKHNGETIASLHADFTEFQHCFEQSDIDIRDERTRIFF